MNRPLMRQDPEGGAVDGEFRFTDEDFRRIATILHADSGIRLPEGKTALVYSRLARRVRLLGLESFRDYCALIASDDGAEERQAMLAALTTNVTRFFREPHHFDHLTTELMPVLAGRARRGGRVRLWSAGCSSGQEPYSMAMSVLTVLPEAGDLDVRILATDIDPNMVRAGREGAYDGALISAIPGEVAKRWLERLPDGRWRMSEVLQRLISFRELNLFDPWPMKGRFDAIFCRNVAIYFEEDAQERLWERYAGVLEPAGRLYVGHSERVGSSLFESDGLTTYRLRAGGGS